ncbi:MAG: glycosyltransferase family 39 protein [Planctomycetota bacterium]
MDTAPATEAAGGDSRAESRAFTRTDTVLAMLLAVGYAGFCGLYAQRRQWLNQFVETDYVFRFVAEAKRLMNGQALILDYHPPAYPAVLAMIKSLGVEDWLTVGLIVSVVSLGITALATYYTLHRVGGRAVALGGTLAFATCPLLLAFGIQATSDIFFLAVYSTTFAAFAHALHRNTPVAWALAGLSLGLTLLTRTNGIILLPLLAMPLLSIFKWPASWIKPLRLTGFSLAACLLPIAIWFAYAIPTGSPLKPVYTWSNLALTFYSPTEDRVSYDNMVLMRQQFTGTLDVLTHDPARIARVYFTDLTQLPGHLFFNLLPWPIVALALPGLFGLFRKGRQPLTAVLFIATFLHILLLNCKAWDPRFYLFVIPLYGAGAACSLVWLWRAPAVVPAWLRRAGVLAACLAALFAMNQARIGMWTHLPRWLNDEFAQSLDFARGVVPPGALLQSRKPHLGHYLDADVSSFPPVSTAADYERWLASIAEGRPTFVYIGHFEQNTQSYEALLADPGFPPPSLEQLAKGPTASGLTWTLYRFHPPAPPASPTPSSKPPASLP